MPSGGQILANNSLSGVSDNASTLAAASAQNSGQKKSGGETNSLNNNEFSKVMETQNASSEGVSAGAELQETGIALDTGVVLVEGQVDKLLNTSQDGISGNTLPLDELQRLSLSDQDIDFQYSGLVDSERLDVGLVPDDELVDELLSGYASTTELTALSAPVLASIATKTTDQALGVKTVNSRPVIDGATIGGSMAGSTGATLSAEGLQIAAVDSDLNMKAGVSTANGVPAASSPNILNQSQSPFMELASQLQVSAKTAYGTKNGDVDLSSLTNLSESSALTGSAVSSAASAIPTNAAASADPAIAYREVSSAVFQTSVPIEAGKPGWSDNIMQKVMWMSSQQINKAEIALDPPELGSLQVRISTQSDQTTVSFTSHQGVVRDALDQGLPRLREMMAEQGIDLADVDVSGQDASEQQAEKDKESQALAQGGEVDQGAFSDEQSLEQQEAVQLESVGLVDQYA